MCIFYRLTGMMKVFRQAECQMSASLDWRTILGIGISLLVVRLKGEWLIIRDYR